MIAVQIADAFILHSDASARELSASRMIIWLVGFVIYRILMAQHMSSKYKKAGCRKTSRFPSVYLPAR